MKIEEKNILVVGCVRNVGNKLINDLQIVQKAIRNFKEKSFLLIESDSTDNTRDLLLECEQKIENFKAISLGKISDQYQFRTETLAYCRNIYVDRINNDDTYKDIDLVLIVDLDGINNLLNHASISSCFEKDNWDAVFANQKEAYYDIFALRHEYWSPTDCRQELDFFEKFRKSRSFNYWHSIYSKMIEIPESNEWIKVNSAFGGAAIYKKECFRNNFYVGRSEDKEICEHIKFNENLIEKGFNLYICPKFINSSINEHTKKKLSLKYKIKFAIQSLFVK